MYYILNGHEPVPTDAGTWAKWFDKTEQRVVCQTTVGEAEVSTVFLGLDHNFGGGPPLLFETMVFGDPAKPFDEDYQERYATWDAAMAGHMAVVYRLTRDAKATP